MSHSKARLFPTYCTAPPSKYWFSKYFLSPHSILVSVPGTGSTKAINPTLSLQECMICSERQSQGWSGVMGGDWGQLDVQRLASEPLSWASARRLSGAMRVLQAERWKLSPSLRSPWQAWLRFQSLSWMKVPLTFSFLVKSLLPSSGKYRDDGGDASLRTRGNPQ